MELIIKETIENLLNVLGIDYTRVVVNEEQEDVYYAQIETDHSSILIGWHGETISALQHVLKCLIWKQKLDPKAQVVLDVDNYKKRQEESVIRLATKKAEYAIDERKEIVLPPMNPYFRRKVHLFLANSDQFKEKVTTESTGSEPTRSVKILPL